MPFFNVFGRPFVKRYTLCYQTCLSVYDVGVLWPNGWMDQDATWYGGRPRPSRHCVRWKPSSPVPKKGADQPLSPIFHPFLLWPNGWMHQDSTWYAWIGLGPVDIVLDGDPARPSTKRGRSPFLQFSAHVYCGQTIGWIKMALSMEVSLGPGHTALDGDPAPFLQKGGTAHQFLAHFYCGQVAGCIKMPLDTKVGLGPDYIV